PEPWEDNDEAALRARLAGRERADRARRAAAAEAFRQMPEGERARVERIRAVLNRRPPVELTDLERAALAQHAEHFGEVERATYSRHLANQRGANLLVKRLGIPADRVDEFKQAYGAVTEGFWPRVRAILESAAANGVQSVPAADRAFLGGLNFLWPLAWVD
ncbi:MAG: hypothetical protein J2P46_16720, partial [Zavarzinella sp.]|nr:hypothetical protein [Zavarzinella sp.]